MKTTGDHEVIFKKELTGGDYQDIQDSLIDSLEITGATEEGMKMNGAVLKKQRDTKIEMIVVSVDGETSNVLDRVRKLPVGDYTEVLDEIEALYEGLTSKKKMK